MRLGKLCIEAGRMHVKRGPFWLPDGLHVWWGDRGVHLFWHYSPHMGRVTFDRAEPHPKGQR